MLVRSPLVSVAVLVLVAFATYELVNVDASGGVMNQNDANSGGDAADAVGLATVLAGPGSYSAILAEADDADWFEYDEVGSGPGCIQLGATGASSITARLGTTGSSTRLSTALGATERILGYAVTNVGDGLAGFTRPVGSVGTAPYDFSTAATAVGAFTGGDGGSGGDAGPTPSSAVVAPGACFGGTLGAVPGDTQDTYKFTVAAGNTVTVSVAQATGEPAVAAKLRDSNGSLLGSGGTITATAPGADTWTIEIAAAGGGARAHIDPLSLVLGDGSSALAAGTSYAIGLCVPYCMMGS